MLESLRMAAREGRLQWQLHALSRMMERGIGREDVISVIADGEVVERYPEATPFPGFLLLGQPRGIPLHVVCAIDTDAERGSVITAYRPDSDHFEEDFKTRRRRS